MKTLVVNLFAGPGAGKTVAAWQIAAELKKRGHITEYVPEFAKDFVWDGRTDLFDGSFANQAFFLEGQQARLERLHGKVEVIVTDSPLLLCPAYMREEEHRAEFLAMCLAGHLKAPSFNLFLKREKTGYEQAGRMHSETEALMLDRKIKDVLWECHIFYGIYKRDRLGLMADNVEKTLLRLGNT